MSSALIMIGTGGNRRMHEESLVRSLLGQVREIERKHQAINTLEIEVEIGPLSGVEPLLLQLAFDRATCTTAGVRGPRLCLHQVPLTLNCQECKTEFEIHELRFECPACHSNRLTVVRGDSIRLLNVQLELPSSGGLAIAGLKS